MTLVATVLDSVEWKALPPLAIIEGMRSDPLPHATHYALLDLCGFTFRCYQLSDGRRVFDADDVERFFAGGE